MPLADCHDPALVGGKAAGLARLVAAGFPVPAGFCVTTAVYHQILGAAGFPVLERWHEALQRSGEGRRRFLHTCQGLILKADITDLAAICREEMRQVACSQPMQWAVRSSATNEDFAQNSCAGLYRTALAVSAENVGVPIKDLWASIWDERVIENMMKAGTTARPPSMAVVIHMMVAAVTAGVASSIHPVSGRDNHVTINAVHGLGLPLVGGTAEPDQYVVETGIEGQPIRLRRHVSAQQRERLVLSLTGLTTERAPDSAALSEQQVFQVAALAKQIEHALHYPVDVEWAYDRERLWVLQARPLTGIRPVSDMTNDECEWSRANFKETMPELPSPMGLSFLEHFMEAYIVSYYRRMGCRIPPGVSPVRTLSGRPYLNVSLFHSLVGQLRADPSLNIEQMGGEPLRSIPKVKPLGWPAFLRAGWLMWKEMRRVIRRGPEYFLEMKALAAQYGRDRIERCTLDELHDHLDHLGRWLDPREVTFGIAAGVGQCLQTFSHLLPQWLGQEWRQLLNASLQGQGTVISAQQILRIAELVQIARGDHAVSGKLRQEQFTPASYRHAFAGTKFLSAFDRYMDDYGHRGLGESDVMSLRFAEQPDALLEVIKTQLRSAAMAPSVIVERQRAVRDQGLAAVKTRCGWRIDRWLVFRWWYRRLCRFFALREANRHHLMWYSAAARNLLLRVGELSVQRGLLAVPGDIFFLTILERQELASGTERKWIAVVNARRAERDRWQSVEVPETLRPGDGAGEVLDPTGNTDHLLRGLPISTGRVTGPIRFVRSSADWSKVQAGDILLAPVIDPGMAPLFGVAGGLIVEMGGMLSHGAIIAREYGLPAVTNVSRAMAILIDGESVTLDADHGHVIRIATSGT